MKYMSTDAPRIAAMALGSLVVPLFVAPAAIGDVVSFSTTGSGSVGVSGLFYDPSNPGNPSTAAFDTALTPTWNGVNPFDDSNLQQLALGGETLDVTTRLQLDATTSNGVTTMAYRETNSMTASSGVDPNRDIGFNYDRAVWINFTTTGWTELDFTNISGGLTNWSGAYLHQNSGDGSLYDIDYSTGSAVVFWEASIPSGYQMDQWTGAGSNNLLLGAGTWTLELNESITGQFTFNDTMNFDMEFSNFVIPGPGGLAGLLGFAAIRRRRRR